MGGRELFGGALRRVQWRGDRLKRLRKVSEDRVKRGWRPGKRFEVALLCYVRRTPMDERDL
jgi:hypothetical protein